MMKRKPGKTKRRQTVRPPIRIPFSSSPEAGHTTHDSRKIKVAKQKKMTMMSSRRRNVLLLLLCLLGTTETAQIRSIPQRRLASTTNAHNRRRLQKRKRLAAENAVVESCEPVGYCESCSRADRSKEEECRATGKKQRYQCVSAGADGNDETRFMYKSCSRTDAEEQFLMIRLQVICFFMGAMSIMSVRRQKSVTASLFDQRKRRASTEIALSSLESILGQESESEMVPLTSSNNDSLDVV